MIFDSLVRLFHAHRGAAEFVKSLLDRIFTVVGLSRCVILFVFARLRFTFINDALALHHSLNKLGHVFGLVVFLLQNFGGLFELFVGVLSHSLLVRLLEELLSFLLDLFFLGSVGLGKLERCLDFRGRNLKLRGADSQLERLSHSQEHGRAKQSDFHL